MIHPWSPVAYWILIAACAGFPLITLAVILADMRWGLFCLDTFFGIVFVALITPVLLVVNAAAILIRTAAG
ncbi:MAG: hypothetical protein O6952_09715 [Planctomycetota bacterium]|nr:hypothetical protein [Planctomycetota bacterium]